MVELKGFSVKGMGMGKGTFSLVLRAPYLDPTNARNA